MADLIAANSTMCVVARGSEWRTWESGILGPEGTDEECEAFQDAVVERFHAICEARGWSEVVWSPECSEVLGYARPEPDHDYDDLAEVRDEAYDSAWGDLAEPTIAEHLL